MKRKATIVHLNSVYAQVFGVNEIDMNMLYKSFRFRKPGWQYSFGMRKHGWDGYTNFFSKDTGKFLSGLVPEIEYGLQQELGYDVEIRVGDKCLDPLKFDKSLLTPELVVVKKRGQSFPLRDYQIASITRMCQYHRGCVVLPTGAGKTNIMAGFLKMTGRAPALVVFRSKNLMKQTYNEFIGAGLPKELIGICYAEEWNPARIVLTTAQSLHYLENILGEIRVLLADECHHGITTNSVVPYLRAMKKCTERFAISATPWKKDNQVHNYKLKGHFGPQLTDVKTQQLQERGILSGARVQFVRMPWPDISDYNADYMKAYREYVVENNDFHVFVSDVAKKMRGRTLILVEWKDHGESLQKLIPNSVWISGDDKLDFRMEVLQQLREAKEIRVISTSIFGVGMDFYLHNLINCAGGASDISTIQRMGRGLRLASDKDKLDYVDFVHTSQKDLERHSKERIRILRKEGHDIQIVENPEEWTPMNS